MTHELSHLLEHWTGFPEVRANFRPGHSLQVATWASARLQKVVLCPPSDLALEKLYWRLVSCRKRGDLIGTADPRDLRRVPWVLFYSPTRSQPMDQGSNRPESHWLAADPDFLQQFLQWLLDSRRTRPQLSLLYQFFQVYPKSLPTFPTLVSSLRKIFLSNSAPRVLSIQKWQERCRDFSLLELHGGIVFVEKLIRKGSDPDGIMRELGIHPQLASSRFLEDGLLEYLANVEIDLRKRTSLSTRLSRLITLLTLGTELRFGANPMRIRIAESFLSPFERCEPTTEVKTILEPFFLSFFGHPLLPYGKPKWSGIRDNVKQVVVRWIVQRDLDSFLALIKDTALDKHWAYREAFWRCLLNRGLIREVWVLLGPMAEERLRAMPSGSTTVGGQGKLLGWQRDQSVLLMRLPGVVVAEWSHNGSCRFWLDGDTDAPTLYKKMYHRQEFTAGVRFVQRHDGSPEGRWQGKIAEWLRLNAGIQVNRSEYFPSRLDHVSEEHFLRGRRVF